MNDELYHHGIDGQRWGIRHGPPYPLGREDHNRVIEKSKKASGKRNISYDKSRKYAKAMTDKDLNDTIDRLQREETYRKLVSKEKEEKKTNKALKKIKREEKKIYNDKQKQQKIQNELTRDKQKTEKKANSIVRKVVQALLVQSATVAGKNFAEYFSNKKIDELKEKDKNKNTDTNENTSSTASDKIKKQQEKVNRIEKDLEAERKKRNKEIKKITPTVSTKEIPDLTLPDVKTDIVNANNIPNMSNDQINDTLIQMYNGVYWSDESEGASL